MPEEFDFAIVGGGASGLAAAIAASQKGESVILLESGPALGKKILASGNGRCNLMNGGNLRYYGDTTFAEAVMSRCGKEELFRFWHDLGVKVTEDSDQRFYPVTFQASTVVDALKTGLMMNGVKVLLNTPCVDIRSGKDGFSILGPNISFFADRILIATGGTASRKTGYNGKGYDFLKKFGHRLLPLRPALVPMNTDRKSISGLAGIRCRCHVSLIGNDDNLLHQERGEVLFTEYGISGICVMQCARFLDEESCRIELDLGDRIFSDDKALMEEMNYRRKRFRNMSPDMLLNGIVHSKISFAVMKQAGLPMRGETIAQMEDNDIYRIIKTFRHYRIYVTGTKGMEEAQVTAGGISCSEFRDQNMESQLIPHVHASGEVLNVDGDCGGYNLMFAFSTGILAGLNGYVNDWIHASGGVQP